MLMLDVNWCITHASMYTARLQVRHAMLLRPDETYMRSVLSKFWLRPALRLTAGMSATSGKQASKGFSSEAC